MVKLQQFSDAVRSRRPHVFVVSETKTNTKLCNSLPHHEYKIFEESAESSNNFHMFKWGMLLCVQKDLQVLQQVITDQHSLKGRMIEIDLALLTLDGQAFTHHIIGTYAPWNPGGSNDDDSSPFWSVLMAFCLYTTTPWLLARDLNATVTPFEHKGGGHEARRLFLKILR